ncbi:hypothetical protein BD560DRAFT_392137 [Blakeslea trispora]|nr:hypothetical protein BD560DRAFT_392137 [Blakeslea trispora]
MEIEYPIDVAILASYFLLIFALLWRIQSFIKTAWKAPKSRVFFLLAMVSLGSTWTYMFQFFFYSYRQWQKTTTLALSLNSISHWLHQTSLFDSAWRQVSVGAWPWLWSHQLCSLTVSVWTPILAIEGYQRQIPFMWAYMLLGQVVAISFASCLAFAVFLAYPVVVTHVPNNLIQRLAVCSAGGLATVVLSPFVAEGTGFMPNLLVMHALLILPLFQTKPAKNNPAPVMIYVFASGANLMIYLQQWFQALASLPVISISQIVTHLTAVWSHPAQASISSDIVCMQLITMTWIWVHRDVDYALLLILLTPILSASVTLPLFFAASYLKPKMN